MFRSILAVTVLAASTAAMAGSYTVKVGASYLDVTGKSDLLNNTVTNVEANDKVNFTPSVEYHFSNSPFSAEVLLAAPFKHSVKSNGAEIATLYHLPPTITAKYTMPLTQSLSASVGVGATVFVPWDVQSKLAGVTIDADPAIGPAAQIGFNFRPADAKNWGVFCDVRYAKLATDITVNGNDAGSLDLDPIVYTLGYSFSF